MPRILVIDDSAADRRLAGGLLEKATGGPLGDVVVEYATNGKDALAMVARQEPDLILTDLQMPQMNGLEVVEEIKRSHATVPVILMTAHGSEEIAITALARGASSYVPKRQLAADLVETVADVLAVSGSRRERQRLVDDCWIQTETHFLLPNNLALVPPLIGHLQDNLARMHVCQETDLVRVAVALREALSNAMIHGNLEVGSEMRDTDEKAYYQLIDERRAQEPYGQRSVQVIAEESRSEAVYVIRDEGRGFDANNLPDPTDPANLERVSGRGLFLIRTFMDEVNFNAKGNEVTMIKRRER
jgi:CheY-like chemotaxis protein